MIASSVIRELSGGARLADIIDKVDGDPTAIQNVANRWRNAGATALDYVGGVGNAVTKVDNAWQGPSSEAFVSYMGKFRRAGEGVDDGLVACASALEKVAEDLRTARREIDAIAGRLLDDAGAYQRRFYKQNPDGTQAQLDKAIAKLANDAADEAEPKLKPVHDEISRAATTIGARIGDAKIYSFSDFKAPTPEQFTATANGWLRTPGYQASDGGSGGSGGSGGGQGGAGAAGVKGEPGYEYGGTSANGGTPAPKAQVVDWIKEALKIITSPEMAGVLAQRGIDVSDLDPNDPTDIQRIWTVIHHESGGNPNAINNWDINAKNGVPSQGLMQTIPPTFNAHKLPGHNEILNPVDNIIAGVLYTYSRYGNLANHPGIESVEHGGPYRPY
ncbi:transglycosylase SLT domain-containing protein [Nonomuraea sp. NPDC050383]|uniref:transglycosylase SLT domain-containing protein n=1 Tax=Nonomuraea sp. NPDC050383 TaxID=3364362 RepID=UPI0037BDF7E5